MASEASYSRVMDVLSAPGLGQHVMRSGSLDSGREGRRHLSTTRGVPVGKGRLGSLSCSVPNAYACLSTLGCVLNWKPSCGPDRPRDTNVASSVLIVRDIWPCRSVASTPPSLDSDAETRSSTSTAGRRGR